MLVRTVIVSACILTMVLASGSPAAPPIDAKENPIYIKSDQLLADTISRTATFSGKVTARQGDLAIYADSMVVRYSADGSAVERVECMGNVRIIQKNRTGTAGSAVYDNRQGTIVLTKNPKVFQGEDMISGSEITYYIADQKSVVTGTPSTRVEAVIHPRGKKDAGPPQ